MRATGRTEPESVPGGGAGRTDEERVLVLAPHGRNARLIEQVLGRAGLGCHPCADAHHLCREASGAVGAAILHENALTPSGVRALAGALAAQPPWSDLPVIILTGGGRTTRGSVQIVRQLGANVTLLERPVRMITLVSAVRSALQARRRQYQVRELLAREHMARADAESASRAKDHFLATLSHELRTPLTPVLLSLSELLRDPALPPAARGELDVARQNVELQARLIDDLLDVTRISRGKLVLRRETVDLHAVVRHAVDISCGGSADAKGLDVRTQLAATRTAVGGDGARLSQVFWNLIRNAVKFTPAGGRIRIATRDAEDDGSVEVTVEDSGVGIEPGALSRIFDEFEQEGHHVTARFGGLGLGLTICKALVELHGGTIRAHSEGRGHGARFLVTLPATAPAPALTPQADPAAGVPGRGPRDGGPQSLGLRILLVEDHEHTAKAMSRILRRMSCEVCDAPDVVTAKQLASSRAFDGVISDLGLPDGSGLDLMRHLRAEYGLIGIALSGYGMDDDVRRSLEAGFARHLTKPIDPAQLGRAIAEVFRATDRGGG
ncbi:MAG TPA: ATP-binding protein [Tepidisphaeraceae bacterium]|nr:ATP-binding protein [Tepidisphaeraceae bacterium]